MLVSSKFGVDKCGADTPVRRSWMPSKIAPAWHFFLCEKADGRDARRSIVSAAFSREDSGQRQLYIHGKRQNGAFFWSDPSEFIS